MTESHPIVDAYVAAINAADLDALVGLFAPGGRLINPFGTFTGTELEAFYRDVVLAGQATLTIGPVAVEGSAVTAEVTAGSPLDPGAGTVRAIDVFRLDAAGAIAELEITYP